MEQMNMSPRQQELFKRLARIPKRILAMYDNENIADFVLHDLCSEKTLNLSKAAYFIDNPDFDCFKGIGGYDNSESHILLDSIWTDVNGFQNHLNKCNFNKKVRTLSMDSIRLNGAQEDILNKQLLKDISSQLGFTNPHYYIWKMKHDNMGIIIFQPALNSESLNIDEDALASLCVLGFCPIY